MLEEFDMALHSTSERYKYIYGSNVTKLDSEEHYGDGTYGAQPEKKRKVRRGGGAGKGRKPGEGGRHPAQ